MAKFKFGSFEGEEQLVELKTPEERKEDLVKQRRELDNLAHSLYVFYDSHMKDIPKRRLALTEEISAIDKELRDSK